VSIRRRGGALAAAVFGAATASAAPAAGTRAAAPSILLVTLDTTRADYVGPRRGGPSVTPHLDALAARGMRYGRALTAAPLTLPAHCSLLTGLDPYAHGVHDNGTASLPAEIPTLATVLSARGYRTGAFVGSRVLDRRFGLARGFAAYDDVMTAERMGEQGYPERDGAAVTAAALAWARTVPAGRPYFLWVHYYDAHAPYTPPGMAPDAPLADRYAGEIASVDREVGRLLAGLRRAPDIVAAVGDHGEMLGEHGEDTHGIFLYRASLEVPLIVAGRGVARGVHAPAVATRGLAATLLTLAGAPAKGFGAPLPAIGGGPPAGITYSETELPATAYGWSALRAVSDERWRYVAAPRPELYDYVADPAEAKNLVTERPDDARRLASALASLDAAARAHPAPAAPVDAEVAEALRSLGYLSGASGTRTGTIDPKDGIALLREFDRAKRLRDEGRVREAVAAFETLVGKSPGNVPFLSRLAEAQAAAGRRDAGIATLKHAIAQNPRLDFLHLHLADAYFELGRVDEARAEYELTTTLDPRSAQAWMGLAAIAQRTGKPAEELAILKRGLATGTRSGAMFARLAQVELALGAVADAERNGRLATELVPEFAAAWWVWGETAEKAGRTTDAATRYAAAIERGLDDPRASLRLGRILAGLGRKDAARPHLQRAAQGGAPADAAEARRLLDTLR
jgi:arylsulfatase A-like enzyme/Flp pilus assembly protein TadD